MADLLTLWAALMFAFFVGCWVEYKIVESDRKKQKQLSKERLRARRRRMGLD